jgi:hypothetical protein
MDLATMNESDGAAALRALRWESARLATFQNHNGFWPYANVPGLRPSEMAVFGFFYTIIGDKVQCAFCQTKINSWRVGNRGEGTAATGHLRFKPDCPLLSGKDDKNIPLDPATGQDVNSYGRAVEVSRLNLHLVGFKPAELPLSVRTLRQQESLKRGEPGTPDAFQKQFTYAQI